MPHPFPIHASHWISTKYFHQFSKQVHNSCPSPHALLHCHDSISQPSCDYVYDLSWLVLWSPYLYSVLLILLIYGILLEPLPVYPYDITLLTHPPACSLIAKTITPQGIYAICWWLCHPVTILSSSSSCLVYAFWWDNKAPKCLVIQLHHSLWLPISHVCI